MSKPRTQGLGSPLHLRRLRGAGAIPVATVHNLEPHSYPVSTVRALGDFTARLGWMQYATIFVHSSGLKEELTRELGPGSPPVVAIPDGVWTGHAAAGPAPSRDGHLLLFGVMRRNRGLHVMLDTLDVYARVCSGPRAEEAHA
jgi:hypothetical protein